jgi:hypothetical protein
VLVVQGGINDIAQRRPVEQAAANLRAMVRRGKELGLRVVIANVLPWNNGWPGAEEPIRRLNELSAEIAREEDVPLLQFHDMLEDPERPGRMREDWTSDGDHPSVEGYRLLGERRIPRTTRSPPRRTGGHEARRHRPRATRAASPRKGRDLRRARPPPASGSAPNLRNTRASRGRP